MCLSHLHAVRSRTGARVSPGYTILAIARSTRVGSSANGSSHHSWIVRRGIARCRTRSNVMFEGTSMLGVDPQCPTCSCDAPVGSCKPPTTWTVGSSACVGNDVWTNFNPPAAWGGSCASNTAIAEGVLCGGTPCVASKKSRVLRMRTCRLSTTSRQQKRTVPTSPKAEHAQELHGPYVQRLVRRACL